MAATINFKNEDPYKSLQSQHPTDYKYSRYVYNKGLENRKTKNKVAVPADKKLINVALFAIGQAGTIHLNNIMRNPRLRLLYIVDDDMKAMEKVKDKWMMTDVKLLEAKDGDKVFGDNSLHAVVIATPTKFHESLASQAIKAGLAVMCEKPIAGNIEATGRVFDLAKKLDIPVLCAFNRRFEPSFKNIRDRVHAGEIGFANIVKTVARDCPLPSLDYLKISGGIFHDCAVHDIDLVCWVLGEYPTEVFAMADANIPQIKQIGDYDTVLFNMRFASGTMANTDISRKAIYGYDQRLEVFGDKGMLQAENERPYRVLMSGEGGATLPPIQYSFPSRYNEGYVEELEHFCDIIQGLDDCCISGQNCINISKIASALEESAKTGKVVKVNY